jgi:hypothetical protein
MSFHVARALALVLTAEGSEKKQQRVTLHCGISGRASPGKNNAAFQPEGGTESGLIPACPASPTGTNGFQAGCAAVASRR